MRKLLLAATVLALISSPLPLRATCGGGGGGGMGGTMPRNSMSSIGGANSQPKPEAYIVPWKTVTASDKPLTTPIVVMWFPADTFEIDQSELNASRMLTLYSAQCVGLQLVKPDDAATIAKFDVATKRPIVLLVVDGKVVDHVEPTGRTITVSSVENMIHHQLYQRETAADALMETAQAESATNKEAAISAYQKVWAEHCLLPKQGRDAQKALKRLGVTVKDAELRSTDPDLSPAMNARITKAMRVAFLAELAADYPKARTLYAAAAAIDPADPVPPRFLGELYRHHTGEWTMARQTFDHVLTMQPDPLSRAVALHGLGKMTIHMGDSAKGLALFEESIAAYPLALTYRNMAVYWNSERQRNKADQYVQKALALDPHDPFNLIFAATYLVDSGRKEEALRIAKENEGELAASYNLAAIYALLGNKGKAMELLKRHFYQYERYDDVRAMEMWEARVDYVFASMKDDPGFVELTKMAR
ncbi:MAG TPA: tetratricopeptide repeat protein [Thermoanaerobaculia bacterium]|jgi:tetratricopeptide (TPR) repeat protein|nr:tetratricopeptide repeat protein [Thermoanaerobaculia bacterium]